jgi:hypothetical protein
MVQPCARATPRTGAHHDIELLAQLLQCDQEQQLGLLFGHLRGGRPPAGLPSVAVIIRLFCGGHLHEGVTSYWSPGRFAHGGWRLCLAVVSLTVIDSRRQPRLPLQCGQCWLGGTC